MTNNSQPLIELKNISKSFKLSWKIKLSKPSHVSVWQWFKNLFSVKQVVVLKNINFKIYHNDKIALLGDNGAGKTTLSNIIGGFSLPSSGEIKFNYNYCNHPQEKVAIQFQTGGFPQNLLVSDVLNFSNILANGLSYETHRLYELLQIAKIKHKKVKSLSGGEQQRLILFTSLVSNPYLIILDEYSNNLDLKSKTELLKYLENYFKKTQIAVIIVSHDAEQIYRFAKTIYVLKNNTISEVIPDLHKCFQNQEELKNYIINQI